MKRLKGEKWVLAEASVAKTRKQGGNAGVCKTKEDQKVQGLTNVSPHGQALPHLLPTRKEGTGSHSLPEGRARMLWHEGSRAWVCGGQDVKWSSCFGRGFGSVFITLHACVSNSIPGHPLDAFTEPQLWLVPVTEASRALRPSPRGTEGGRIRTTRWSFFRAVCDRVEDVSPRSRVSKRRYEQVRNCVKFFFCVY